MRLSLPASCRLATLPLVAAGCTAPLPAPSTWLPISSDDVIVDDQDGSPTFTTSGDDWTTWSMPSGEGYDSGDTSYHYQSAYVGDGDQRSSATWTPTLSAAGTWEVSTWFRRTSNRTDDADHYVYDATGASHHVTIDQTGEGPSDWVSLGEYACNAGSGGCYVVLKGDGDSDEANAMRFTLVSGTLPETSPCDEVPTPGSHTWEWNAGSIDDEGWEDTSNARGAEDGDEAHSPNVDAGEHLTASDWGVCDPDGDETISRVELGVRARMQYDSGTYALVLALDGGGSARTTFSRTSLGWETVDLTGDRAWTWADLEGMEAAVTLEDHPGGARDSDAWVDAFRLKVTFVTPDDPPPTDTGVPPVDTGVPPTDTGVPPTDTGPAGDTATGDETGDPGSAGPPGVYGGEGCNCATGGAPSLRWEMAPILGLLGLVRRRSGRSRGAGRP